MIKFRNKNDEYIYFNPMTIKAVMPHVYTENGKVYNKTYIECVDSTSYVVDEKVEYVVKVLSKALTDRR